MTKLFLTIIIFSITTTGILQAQFSHKSEKTVDELMRRHQSQPRAETYYLMAMSATQKGDYTEAMKAVDTGLSISPANTRLMNLRGAILARRGRLADARNHFIHVLQIDPDDRYAAQSLRNIERFMQPESLPMPVLRPQKPAPQEPEEMAKPEIQPLEKPVNFFHDMHQMQSCYYSMENIYRAYQDYISNDSSPGDFSITTLVSSNYLTSPPICPSGGIYEEDDGDIYCSDHGHREEAGTQTNNVFVDYNRGLRAKLGRNFLDALKAFEQVTILYPTWPDAHFQKADTLFRLNEPDHAIVALRNCLRHDPEHIDAQLLLANIYFRKGQKEAALNLLDNITEKHEGTIYALSARSVAASIRSGRNYYEIFPPH